MPLIACFVYLLSSRKAKSDEVYITITMEIDFAFCLCAKENMIIFFLFFNCVLLVEFTFCWS